jgi:hypothetical protein
MTKRIALLALLATGLTVAFAQDGKPAGAGDETERDPFAASDRMRGGEGDRSRFVPADAPPALPGLALRGYVEDEEGKSVALLEVDGATTYLVRKDDTVSLPRAGANLVMRVVQVTNLELHVEIGELKRVVVVR